MKKRKVLYKKELNKIHAFIQKFEELDDPALQAKTTEFKERLAKGETTDHMMEEAFAVVCVADKRVLGMMPYDVQIEAAIALHRCYLAEMNTGEGKTLTATMPLYLNALTGKSTILVTANEYLAGRDAEEMGPVYEFLGLTVKSCAAPENSKDNSSQMTNEQKRECYHADIFYTTHSALGFDYLLENLVDSAEDRFMRDFYYVIIDEADAVLLDSASTPLVISGAPRVQSNLYGICDFFVSVLKEDEDYEVEDKSVWLTDAGVKYAEHFFGIDNFYSPEHFEINRHVTLALRARTLFELQKNYMISEKGEIVLLDDGTGRQMQGMKMRGGQHQAIEMKEGVKLSQEQRSMASVTYQNLFLMFPRMSGMSGTMYDARKELKSVYHRKVVRIPTNNPKIRKDLPDRYFVTAEEQYQAVIDDVKKRHATGQPILIITSTIQDTRIISQMLLEISIPHSVLNASNAYWEADIIKEAGRVGAVTVSTGIAGRGTDIKLKKEAKDLGGLAVIGIGRMANSRQEGQARGRAGRQGDPGMSQFYVSLEDDVVKIQGEDLIDKLIDKHPHMSRHRLKSLIDGAQKMTENSAVGSREMAMKYDRVLKRQRTILYAARNRLLDQGEVTDQTMHEILTWDIRDFVHRHRDARQQDINRFILDNLSFQLDFEWHSYRENGGKALADSLLAYAKDIYVKKMQTFRSREESQTYLRACILNALDECWIEEVDYLQQLQYASAGMATAQRNPLFEYSEAAYQAFGDMKDTMRRKIVRNVFLGSAEYDAAGKMQIVYP